MALIAKMERVSRKASVHSEVETTYNVVSKAGKKYVQLNTHGSKERKIKGAVSQIFQLSEEAINQLNEIIKNES